MKKPIVLTKEFEFDAAHYLENYEGDCANLHGHRYKLAVSILGYVNEEKYLAIDFKDLKRISKELIIDKLDHQNLNEVLNFNTSCENIVYWIWETLENEFVKYDCKLYEVKLWETPDSYAVLNHQIMNEGI
ncbi:MULTISPECIES: 6-carboxytetrahydropterin synthase QueD [unclassified Candidatus Frackibacter]|uniref:6-carboxytetrahydropterin synthase QueD n=1 Tax=unclassified Candidatus Frackibacter TaxID=2648818 RepID=UPI000794A5A0|nr:MULTISPECIES: 6-carboxytetrahydropterin synthase QueD [unclassified Candidatus Frackibacter]KXS41706.1 MAG: 6-pyruvoyl tetrahydrobiopterin synthase [Candidatus Frackibacter sp. T328-2]SDC37491.1 6-pyruvoyltetrahydropterin/6-carboxytetrahydropterin synthase [Candidatus Frackibacter sp. WG11]SEM62628.1 6-pyruvoyltetrahydropterin/6-carboxytetrahydropterin synthase [Candidatus Frackibacter sp. WG12]SFL65162.1 6-pyruvoyltetrahydropterin/6-carboxytetrahydropterin synthase [Candidatus Frackibacter 